MITAPHLAERLRPLGSPMEFRKGALLFEQGQPATGVFVLSAGRACLSLLDKTGSPVWSRIAGPGAVLGLPSSVSGQAYSLNAVALENLQAVFIGHVAVKEVLQRDSAIIGEVVSTLSVELSALRKRMASVKSPAKRRTRSSAAR